MGLFLVALVLIIGGIGLLYITDGISSIMIVVGGLLAVILIMCAIDAPYDGKRLLVEYEIDKAYLDSVYTLEYISEQERNKAVDLIIKDNKIINQYNINSNNFWISIYYYEEVGELEFFDVSRVPQVNGRQEFNINQ
jgi:hypothetical protein